MPRFPGRTLKNREPTMGDRRTTGCNRRGHPFPPRPGARSGVVPGAPPPTAQTGRLAAPLIGLRPTPPVGRRRVSDTPEDRSWPPLGDRPRAGEIGRMGDLQVALFARHHGDPRSGTGHRLGGVGVVFPARPRNASTTTSMRNTCGSAPGPAPVRVGGPGRPPAGTVSRLPGPRAPHHGVGDGSHQRGDQPRWSRNGRAASWKASSSLGPRRALPPTLPARSDAGWRRRGRP